MGEKYFTIKLTLTKIGEGRYRSRIEQSPKGASGGLGGDFALDKTVGAPQEDHPSVAAFQQALASGTPSLEDLTKFGGWLFRLVFRDEVRVKYQECLAVADAQKAKLRICLSVLEPQLIDVPWEYFHDGSGFLLQAGRSIVRVIDELVERSAPFAPIQQLLVAIANPSDPDGEYECFDAQAHLDLLQARFANIGGLEPRILMPAGKSDILTELADNQYDAFYFLGHGQYSAATGGHLICESPEHRPDPLYASRLAQALSESHTVRFAYLNSCSTARTSQSNPFLGVAQRLMRDGDVAAVVAMQVKVGQEAAMNMAEKFFGQLRKGRSPEQAMLEGRGAADDHFSFGVPVIYTHLGGPERFDQNRLAALLSAKIGESKYALLLPTFERGVRSEDAPKVKVTVEPAETYTYPGPTFAETDIMAAGYVTELLTRIADVGDIRLLPVTDRKYAAEASHRFAFGSKSNEYATSVLNKFSPSFRFTYHPDRWVLEDLEYGKSYEISDPSRLGDEYFRREDFGVIQKIVQEEQVFYIISGLGDRATQGCGWYLLNKWESLLDRYGDKPFGLILRFHGGMDFFDSQEIGRGPAANGV
jgi:hypothetical protein